VEIIGCVAAWNDKFINLNKTENYSLIMLVVIANNDLEIRVSKILNSGIYSPYLKMIYQALSRTFAKK
jgi:hypothetical protein